MTSIFCRRVAAPATAWTKATYGNYVVRPPAKLHLPVIFDILRNLQDRHTTHRVDFVV